MSIEIHQRATRGGREFKMMSQAIRLFLKYALRALQVAPSLCSGKVWC